MFFNKYPNTNFHELNLDWIISEIKKLHTYWDEFAVINKISFDGLWTIEKAYPAWTIVDTPNHSGYISIKPVPIGVNIDNEDYWRQVANYSELYADMQNRIIQIENVVNDLSGRVEEAEQTVSDLGDRVENIDNKIDTELEAIKIESSQRVKLGWYTGTATRIYANMFNMNGFRFAGQYKKNGKKVYKTDAAHSVGENSIANFSDIDVVSGIIYDSWYGIFAVPVSNNECTMKIAPFFRISGILGDDITLAQTKENTENVPLTVSLKDLTGRDVLLISADNQIYGSVDKIASNTSNTIKLEGTHNLAVGDYILIAPSNDYCYLASHYVDTANWRNRQDDGRIVKSYGVQHIDTITTGADYNLKNLNDFSPLAMGVIFRTETTMSSSGTGFVYLFSGEDASHAILDQGYRKNSTSSEVFASNQIQTNFGYRYQITVKIVCNWLPGATNKLWVQGFVEP